MTASVGALLAEAGAPGDDLRRDAEVLLSHLLSKPRSYLYAWPEAAVEGKLASAYAHALAECRRGVPVAYLTGEREFWSLPLSVSPATLIPRPETERLVELALDLPLPVKARVVDLGTGSGAIVLALASERRGWQFSAVEQSAEALAMARRNGAQLSLDQVRWLQGNWFEPLAGERFDLVVANPPYLAEDDPHLHRGDLRFEPASALVAKDNALAALFAIVQLAPAHLVDDGWLLLEHGCEQGDAVRRRLSERGFMSVQTWQDAAGLDRVSGGYWREE